MNENTDVPPGSPVPRPDDPWTLLRQSTPARIALGRSGNAMPTREVLRFSLDHARARDAVHCALDVQALQQQLTLLGRDSLCVSSSAPNRASYLRRPDLGRRLSRQDAARLDALAMPPGDLCLVLADGLSAQAVQRHALPVLQALWERLPAAWLVAPVVLATQARVALGDDIASRLRSRMVAVLIGERPGLSSPDSMGIYLTWAPRTGCLDSQRNCLSNIRPQGLTYAEAASRLAWLMREAASRGITGVALKDESQAAPRLPGAPG